VVVRCKAQFHHLKIATNKAKNNKISTEEKKEKHISQNAAKLHVVVSFGIPFYLVL